MLSSMQTSPPMKQAACGRTIMVGFLQRPKMAHFLDIRKNRHGASGKQEVSQKEMDAFPLFLTSSFVHEKPIFLAFCQPEFFVNKRTLPASLASENTQSSGCFEDYNPEMLV